MQADSVPSDQKSSCKWNLLFSKAVFSLVQPAPYNQLLTQPLSLFQNAILHKMLKLGFWNFKSIFLRMQFSLVATFFSLVLVISLSWYFHLTISYLTLWKPNGLSKHLKGKVSSYMDNIKVLLRSRLNLGFNLNYFSFLL